MRILLVYNLRTVDRMALEMAKMLAGLIEKGGGKEGLEVILLHVVGNAKERSKGEAVMAEAANQLAPYISSLTTKLLIGEETTEIIHEVCMPRDQPCYDLLIMGWRQKPNLLRPLIRSATEKILNSVTCPIIVVKEEVHPLQRILICDSGVEDQPLPELMATCLPQLMPKDLEVTILHVMSQIGIHPTTPAWQLRANAEDLIQAHTPEGEVLTRDARLLNSLGIKPQLKIRHGFVVEEILTEAKEGGYDLVVLGAHEPIGGIPSLLLEDQAHPVIKATNLPVLLFHRRRELIS